MFVEMHMLQNFAPANLNRDDTGAPKDCEFGGYRRARISSQCLKRAIRTSFGDYGLLTADQVGTRTKRLRHRLVERLVEAGRDRDGAETVASHAVEALDLRFERNTDRTQYLLFLGMQEINRLVELCQEHWDELSKDEKPSTSTGNAFQGQLDGGKAADVALFGRMLADLPERNVDAASQVAHAISTNRVEMEFDFYTAVDDLNPEDTEGAGMLGTVEFNSACFYRYANVDLGQLLRNLDGDGELARQTLQTYLRAMKDAVPSGKQNSMAAQNPPSFVMVVVKDSGLWSMANAFLRPIRPAHDGDLVSTAQRALDSYWGKLTRMYGTDGIHGVWWCALDDEGMENLEGNCIDGFDELVERVVATASTGETEVRAA